MWCTSDCFYPTPVSYTHLDVYKRQAPGYKVAKKLLQILKSNIKIDINHSVRNCIEFVDRVKSLVVLPQYKLVSFDVTNLYTNVPVPQTIDILQKCNGLKLL